MRTLERLLWSSRLIMLLPIVASLLSSILTLVIASISLVEIVPTLPNLFRGFTSEINTTEQTLVITTVIKSIDIYLLSAVLFVFSLGLFELFIKRIEVAGNLEIASSLLIIKSLDDLKDRLVKIVVLLLVVAFLQEALSLHYTSPLDLLYLAISIALVGGAIFLSSRLPHGADEGSSA
ncbi:MAG: YqhA family protein [Chloroflexi bacterium]|nr:YqhA family protein [Chloroflexota bacterium]